MMEQEKIKFIKSIIFPLSFTILIWAIEIVKQIYHLDLGKYGILPLKVEGLPGILLSPLIHENFEHLFSNTIPLFVTTTIIFYFYSEVAFQTFFLIYFITGFWVWVFARDAYHIGASGIVYGLVSFVFFSGIIRRNIQLMALSLLMVFLYGGTIWGIFPDFFPDKNISWESHLMGLIAGFIIAVFYRKTGTQRKQYDWEFEEDDEDAKEYISNQDSTLKITYYYKEKNPEQ